MRSRPLAAILSALVSAAVGGLAAPRASGEPAVAEVSLPGPAPRGHASSVAADNAACERCHADIAAEWRGSMHRGAWIDPVFQEALALEPFPFCRGCHAPEADPRADPDEGARDTGVGCTTCHVEGSDVVGTRAVSRATGGHAVLGDARLATDAACAGCHQFDFPATKGAPMQNTVAEHASSTLKSIACQGCHMREIETTDGKKHKSHRFSVIGDPDMVRSAASVVATRTGAREVRVSIEPTNVGHAFPTGDMFRRLEIRAAALDADGRVIEEAPVVHLLRTFADRSRASRDAEFARVQIGDTRVPAPGAGERRGVVLRFERPVEASRVRWSVVYQRMGTAMAASFGLQQARDEIVVAEGVLSGRDASVSRKPPSESRNP